MSTETFLGTDWNGRIFTGDWVDGAADPTPVVEPATGETLARIGPTRAEER